MRTALEIKKQQQEDIEFIVSAVTTELHDLAYIEYFSVWENNGGMQWFFTECVDITREIMLSDGSAYLKWFEHWKNSEGNSWECFSTIIGECFDWYHMTEARELFERRYEKEKDEQSDINTQLGERIGFMLSNIETLEDRNEIRVISEKECKKALARREELAKAEKVKKIVDFIDGLDVDGETMQEVLERVGMDDQMYRQLVMSKDIEDTYELLQEKKEL